jgi:diguanylate cyclase (GGDEF)-like protein
MSRTVIAISSDRSELARSLAERCPHWDFSEAGEAWGKSAVGIVEGARPAVDRTRARIVIGGDPEHAAGELHLTHEMFLASPAEYIAFALDLAAAAVEAERAGREAGYLRQVHSLMTLVDSDDVSQQIASTVLGIIGLRYAALYLHDPRLERYVVSFSNDEAARDTGEFLPGIPPALLQGALNAPERMAMERKPNGAGMLIMPLQVGDDLLGVIKVTIAKDDTVDPDKLVEASRYIGAVTQVVSNIYQLTRSRDLAMLDDLTKAFNRRYFDSYLEEEIERSRRYGAQLSIIFLDLDDLKKVNNSYGHLAGSRTLQEVAKRILGAVRTIDKVVRFGGDEFCIILPQTDQDQAMLVANRVKKAMTQASFELDPGIDISITASFGIATYPTHGTQKDELIRVADAAMYRVKSTTKNAVGVATVDDAMRPANA